MNRLRGDGASTPGGTMSNINNTQGEQVKQTLDNMTVEQLRDLATRANNTAAAQEKATAMAKKDIIPGVGETWKYDGRYFTVVGWDGEDGKRLIVSCNTSGKDYRWRGMCREVKFSQVLQPNGAKHSRIAPLSIYGVDLNAALRGSMERAVTKLALIADGQLPLDP